MCVYVHDQQNNIIIIWHKCNKMAGTIPFILSAVTRYLLVMQF